MSRAYNFSAGPAMLPEAVLRRAQEDQRKQAAIAIEAG